MGIVKPREALQVSRIDTALRYSLWNTVVSAFGNDWRKLAGLLFDKHCKLPVDSLPDKSYCEHRGGRDENSPCRHWLLDKFNCCPWYEVYDLLECIVTNLNLLQPDAVLQRQFLQEVSQVLEREGSGYRLIGTEFAPIASEADIAAIEAAQRSPLVGASTHISKGLSCFARKPEPDYHNCIKESITAVESVCKIIVGDDKATLGKVLSKLDSVMPIHKSLRQSMDFLYAFTNDEGGIRHAGSTKSEVGCAEARFCLVTCSALVGYLTDKARETGLLS
jgi:hypothetical protein